MRQGLQWGWVGYVSLMVARAQETEVTSGTQEKAPSHPYGPGSWRMRSSTKKTQVGPCGKPVLPKGRGKEQRGQRLRRRVGDHGPRAQGRLSGAGRAGQWEQLGLGGLTEGTWHGGGKGSRSKGLEFEHVPCQGGGLAAGPGRRRGLEG